MSRLSVWLAAIVLLCYFIFTSGLIYEALGSNVMDKIVVPYSIALSGERTGLAREFTADDVRCAEWIVQEKKYPMSADYAAYKFLGGYAKVNDLSIIGTNNLSYLFLTTWNTKRQKMVMANAGEGLRQLVDLPDISAMEEIFRSGQSAVYKK